MRPDPNRFDRTESGLHQQLQIALVPEAEDRAAVTARIYSRSEQTASFDEGMLIGHAFLQQLERKPSTRTLGDAIAPREVVGPRVRRECIHDPLLERRAVRHRQLVDYQRGGERDLP